MSRTITVGHLARVEGHGGIFVHLVGNKVEKVEFRISEGMRFFEALVLGRQFIEIPSLVSRICAICSHNHAITAAMALEHALGIETSRQTKLLRDLAFQGAAIESHALHVFMLALPDFLQHPSVISLASENPELVKVALQLKKLGNTIQEVVGGRAVHPVNYVVGGFGRLPTCEELGALLPLLDQGLTLAMKAVEAISAITIPKVVNDTLDFAALVPEEDFFFFGTQVRHSDGTVFPVAEYRAFTNERVVSHSHAKHSLWKGRPFMVGALARLALNSDRVQGAARKAWETLSFDPKSGNVLYNNIAQLIEMVFAIERAKEILVGLLSEGLRPEEPIKIQAKAGYGVAATEVPRGTLYHAYEISGSGEVVSADIITPTAQNAAHVEAQVRVHAETLADQVNDEALKHVLEMVARAYDPCISCSVHLLRKS